MAVSVSLINMKGGVGKTTLAAQLAHAADQRGLRTLAVDLDPQANLSQSILSPEKYVSLLRTRKPTVARLLEMYAPPQGDSGSPSPLRVRQVIQRKAGYWRNSSLDLIPSRLELAETLKIATTNPRWLARALSSLTERYDLILIDCAPTESVLTEAAYYASRHVLVPVKPEYLATIGLPLLARSIHEFKSSHGDQELDICGIVFNHADYSLSPEGRRSILEVQAEARKHGWPVFDTHIRYSRSYVKAAREGTPLGKTSHVHAYVAAEFSRFVNEFLRAIGLGEETR
jgi:chromosome partitioning protein